MTTIKLKNGSGAPLAGDLVVGEPALDLTNKRLYTEDSGGTVIEVGTNPSTINIDAGTIDGTVIGGSTAAAGSFTTFTSTGIDDNAASTAITIDSSQNVGIGTSSPQRQLHVSKNANNTHIAIERDGTDNPSALILGANQNKTEIISSAAEESTSGVPLTFLTGNTERMRLDASGNVGIGTSSPNFYTGQTTLNINSAGVARLDLDIGNTMQGYLLAESGYTGLFTPSGSNSLRFGTNNTERMRIRSDGTTTIGRAISPTYTNGDGYPLHVQASGGGQTYISLSLPGDTSGDTGFVLGHDGTGTRLANREDEPIIFMKATGETMRIDASGNLLVGTTDDVVQTNSGTGNGGIVLRNNNYVAVASDGSAALELNRLASDGEIANFRKDGTTVGSIGTGYGVIDIKGGSAGLLMGNTAVLPVNGSGTLTDGAYDIGTGSFRFKDIYLSGAVNLGGDVLPTTDAGFAGHSDLGDPAKRFEDAYVRDGVTTGSDGRDKQDIEELSDAEQRVAVACKGLLRKWRWIDSVEEKGDDARIHFGIIAQDLQDAFTAEGLDAGRYAMFISSTWWESTEVIPAVEAQEAVVDEEGNVVEEAVEAQEERTVVHTHQTAEEAPEGSVERTRLGVRYSELLAFIIAAI